MIAAISGHAVAGDAMPIGATPRLPPAAQRPAATGTGVLGQARPPTRLAELSSGMPAIVRRWGAQLAPGIARALRDPAAPNSVPPALKALPMTRPIFDGRDPVVLLPGARFDNATAEAIDVLRTTLNGFWLAGIESMQDDAQRLYACSLVAQAISEFLAGRLSQAQLKDAIGLIVHDAQFFELPPTAARAPTPDATPAVPDLALPATQEQPVADLALPSLPAPHPLTLAELMSGTTTPAVASVEPEFSRAVPVLDLAALGLADSLPGLAGASRTREERNSLSAAVRLERRRAGLASNGSGAAPSNVSALGSFYGRLPDTGRTTRVDGSFVHPQGFSLDALIAHIGQSDGTRGIVLVRYAGLGKGHAVVAENINGRVQFFDGASGARLDPRALSSGAVVDGAAVRRALRHPGRALPERADVSYAFLETSDIGTPYPLPADMRQGVITAIRRSGDGRKLATVRLIDPEQLVEVDLTHDSASLLFQRAGENVYLTEAGNGAPAGTPWRLSPQRSVPMPASLKALKRFEFGHETRSAWAFPSPMAVPGTLGSRDYHLPANRWPEVYKYLSARPGSRLILERFDRRPDGTLQVASRALLTSDPAGRVYGADEAGNLTLASDRGLPVGSGIAATPANDAGFLVSTRTERLAAFDALLFDRAANEGSATPMLSPQFATWLDSVNPGWPGVEGRAINCERCTIATALSIAGRPAAATAVPDGTPHAASSDFLEAAFGSKFRPATLLGIWQQLLGAGPGAQGIVQLTFWEGRVHFFNAAAYRDPASGRQYVVLIDGQTHRARIVSSADLRHPGRLLRTFAAEQIRIRTSALRDSIHPLDAELAELLEQGDAAPLDDFALRHIELRFMRVDGRNDHPPASGAADPD